MRISDWSSDVCSSDLLLDGTQGQTVRVFACDEPDQCLNPTFRDMSLSSAKAIRPRVAALIGSMVTAIRSDTAIGDAEKELLQVASVRSEEHTSELQSLMRISYAVFCLKKTNKQ